MSYNEVTLVQSMFSADVVDVFSAVTVVACLSHCEQLVNKCVCQSY